MADEYWENSLRSINGVPSPIRIPKMYRAVSRQIQNHFFSCWDQFLDMSFAQLTYRESLPEIQTCLRGNQKKLYHMSFRGNVSRNTLAHTNQVRDWRIYATSPRS